MSSFTVAAKPFHEALSRALGAVERVKSQPLFAMIRLQIEDDELEIFAQDGIAQIAVRIPADGACDPVYIDSIKLAAIAGTVKDRGELRIAFEGAEFVSARIVAGRSRYTLDTVKPETVGTLNIEAVKARYTAPGKPLVAMLAALQPAISTETTRYYLNGVCLERGAVFDARSAGALLGVATNGLALCARHIQIEDLPTELPRIIVPRLTCAAVVKLFAAADSIAVAFGDMAISFAAGNTVFASKLVAGTFPDWRRVTPLDRTTSHAYEAKQLVAAVAASAVTVEPGKTGKLVRIGFGDDETEFSAQSLANPGVTGADACQHSTLGPAGVSVIGANADYFVEMVGALAAETIEIGCASAMDPILLRAAGLDDRIAVVMPVRI